MFSQAILISILTVLAEARFGQEQVPISAISALSAFGQSGQAATLAGGSIQFLLAAANPCGKLTQADNIVSELGTDPQVISAARGLVAAEQNFNPFVVSVPNICSDPTLPSTAALRGVIPLVDPAVGGSTGENTNSAASITTPFKAGNFSVADVMVAQGFSNFTTTDSAGTKGTPGASASNATTASNNVAIGLSNSTAGVQQSTIAGLDFGLCVPTMKFEAGLDGRADTEFTFQAIDPLVNKGQEEALNPNIITNRICDQLTNVCNANAAAKAACATAKTTISGLGTKDVTTANAWNTALGFDGTNPNPDNAPQTGLVGHT